MIVLPDFSPAPDAKPPVKNGGRVMRQNDAQPVDGASLDDRFAAQFMQHFMQQASPDSDVRFDMDFVEDSADAIEAESDAAASVDSRLDHAAAQQLLALLNPAAGIQVNAGLNEKATATLDETNDADRTANLPPDDVQSTGQTRKNRLNAGDFALENTGQSPGPTARHASNAAPAAQAETAQQAAWLSALESTTTLSGLSSGAEPSPLLTPNQTLLPAALNTTFIASNAALVPAPATLPLTTSFNQPDWGQAMMQQVVQTLANGKQIQHAELRLNPPDLGALQVTLRIEGTHAQAWFASPHAHVREAVHNALPELAQQLQQSGLALSDAQVGSEQRQFAASEQAFAQSNRHSQNQNPSQDSTQNPSGSSTPAAQSGTTPIQTHATGTRSLLRVDTYA